MKTLLDYAQATQGVQGSSKKDAGLRRQELLGSGKGSLATELTAACAANAAKLLINPKGCDLMVEAACGAEGGVHSQLIHISLFILYI
jgi:hypothetical protein